MIWKYENQWLFWLQIFFSSSKIPIIKLRFFFGGIISIAIKIQKKKTAFSNNEFIYHLKRGKKLNEREQLPKHRCFFSSLNSCKYIEWAIALIQNGKSFIIIMYSFHTQEAVAAATCQLYTVYHTESFNIKVLHRLRKLRAFNWCLHSFIPFICHLFWITFFSLQIHLFRMKATPTTATTKKKSNVTFFISKGLNLMYKELMLWNPILVDVPRA